MPEGTAPWSTPEPGPRPRGADVSEDATVPALEGKAEAADATVAHPDATDGTTDGTVGRDPNASVPKDPTVLGGVS